MREMCHLCVVAAIVDCLGFRRSRRIWDLWRLRLWSLTGANRRCPEMEGPQYSCWLLSLRQWHSHQNPDYWLEYSTAPILAALDFVGMIAGY